MSNDDPFADLGFPEDLTAPDEKPARPEPAPRQQTPAPRAAVQWRVNDFEVQPVKGARRCDTCASFIPGGDFAIDRIVEVDMCDELTDFQIECRDATREFERRELEQIIEKKRTLDCEYDQPPRVKSYCAAALAGGRSAYLIPEIKNHDGNCADHKVGKRPWVKCGDCRHCSAPSTTRPSLADYQVDADSLAVFRDPDFKYDVSTLRGMYDRADDTYNRRERQYAERLKADVNSVVYGDGSVINGTIETCDKFWTACAIVNRTSRCVSFEDKTPLAILKNNAFAELDLSRFQAFDRASEESAAAAEKRRAIEDRAEPRPPCFDCAHKREPVDVDPFREVHNNNRDIMDLRNEYSREQKRQAVEERRISSAPGDTFGDADAPTRNLWCEKHSRKAADGTILEYAYCYRVLRTLAPKGECPSYAPPAAMKRKERAAPAPADDPISQAIGRIAPILIAAVAEPPAGETPEERSRRWALEAHDEKRLRKERGRRRRPRPG